MPESEDQWRTLHQVLPMDVYSRLMVQLGRMARANGISSEAFQQDDKTMPHVGPRVAVWENLVILCERTESEDTFRV